MSPRYSTARRSASLTGRPTSLLRWILVLAVTWYVAYKLGYHLIDKVVL